MSSFALVSTNTGKNRLRIYFSKVIALIGNVKNDKLEAKIMISFLLLTLLCFFSFIAEKEMRENLVCLFVGLVTCYILNMQILFKIVRNPFCIVEDKNEQKNENRMLIVLCSILIVLMIIINLYLLVLWTYFSFDGAYMCDCNIAITKWQLLYYTVISFTTVGYGDICPVIFQSQVVSILISITSVICLIIFINSILSAKEAIFDDTKETVKIESRQEIERK